MSEYTFKWFILEMLDVYNEFVGACLSVVPRDGASEILQKALQRLDRLF